MLTRKISTLLVRATGMPNPSVTTPARPVFGEYTTNIAFALAAPWGVSPLRAAERLRAALLSEAPSGFFERVEVVAPGFLNFHLTEAALRSALRGIITAGESYGSSRAGRGRRVIVEYSSVNVAKPMHVGHLRATVLGDALANMHAFLGYKVIRWNYLGDWGTQFGKTIAAYKLWGSREAVERNPIAELVSLYVRFHDEARVQPDLERVAQEEFRALEAGDRENRRLWRWFRRLSLKDFRRLYTLLGVRFDSYIGESFYEPMLKPLIARLVAEGIAEESQGALIVPLTEEKLPPALVRKSDGSSLYLTRDLANLAYRLSTFKPAKILYVVGNEQSLHFEQVFAVAKRMGLSGAELEHIKFGAILGENAKKFATREGRVVLADDVVTRAVSLARGVVDAKNPSLSDSSRRRVASAVGIGALKYNDLSQHRLSDIVFHWEKMLALDGNSGPYLQYTYARLASILRKACRTAPAIRGGFTEAERLVARELLYFPGRVSLSAERCEPNLLAEYLYSLANAVNALYEREPILRAESRDRARRLALISAASGVLKRGLGLLGIKVVERM